MASIRRKLEKKGVIAMALLTLVLIGTACEDRIDNPEVNPTEGKTVEVTLNIGFANEVDGTTRSADTKAPNNSGGNKQSAFDMQLVPASQTRAAAVVTTDHPDKLYNLEIHQYRSDGTCLASFTGENSIDPGTAITSTLNDNGGAECSLLIIARGATGAVDPLSGKLLSQVNAIIADKTKLEAVDAITGDKINNMPYLLYLPKVKIVDGKLVSPEGTDVRLLLKRLAVGVSIDWTFSDEMKANYTLSEVRLMQVPKVYRILPENEYDPTFGTMYPKTLSEFVSGFRLKGETLTNNGSQTFWMPANARGTRNDVNYPTYRNKNYAHSSATYVEFVVDKNTGSERLIYRAYLGGNTTSDFNLLENTNYHWTINITAANYTTDPRIQLQDLSPVISTNLQTTSNCFMLLPGTNICFNPYKHEAGESGWNTELVADGSIKNGKEIKKVKVLWQNKDAGTSGELVMGYPISESNHSNLVNLTGDDVDNARIHLKVPLTNGGNALIAAYGEDEKTALWSWHVWGSDYIPALLGDFTAGNSESRANAIDAAQKATRGGIVHTYQGDSWTQQTGAFYKKVIMDRNLGAIRAVPALDSDLESARTYGVLYQWGRKDPMPGSADGSSEEINTIFNADGYTIPLGKSEGGSLDKSIVNPSTFYQKLYLANGSWGPATKTIYDPCPKGWKVPDFYGTTTSMMFDGFELGSNMALVNNGKWYTSQIQTAVTKATNGILYLYPEESYENYTSKYVWFPMFWMREGFGQLRNSDACFVMYSAHESSSEKNHAYYTEIKAYGLCLLTNEKLASKPYGFSVRCIQE